MLKSAGHFPYIYCPDYVVRQIEDPQTGCGFGCLVLLAAYVQKKSATLSEDCRF